MKKVLGEPQALKLILGLNRRQVLAEVAADTEVLPGLPWVNVAGLKSWLRGVAVHKAELLPVVDLSDLLDAQPLRGSVDKNPIVSVGAGGFRTGFLVASVDPAPTGEVDTEADMGNLDPINLDELCLAVLADPHAVPRVGQ